MADKRPKIRDLLSSRKAIKQNLDLLDKSVDDLYRDTHMTTIEDKRDSDRIRGEIDDSINGINNGRGYNNTSIGNLTKIYTRAALQDVHGDKKVIDAMSIFEDNLLMDNIVSTWIENKWIKDLDLEIDTVLKYMPKLKEALECKKDCVLSADHFSKDFVTFTSITSQSKEALFNDRMEEIKRAYKLVEEIEKWYDKAQTYGEQFIYIVPYNEAFKKLLKDKNNGVFHQPSLSEISLFENGCLNESVLKVDPSLEKGKELINHVNEMLNESHISNVNITFNTGFITSLTEAADKLYEVNQTKKNIITSVGEQFIALNEADLATNRSVKPPKNRVGSKNSFTTTVPDDLTLPKDIEDGTEMLINVSSKESDNIKIDIPGCIVKTLERENIIPIYIDDVCLGYYYFEFKDGFSFDDPNNFEYSASINTLGSHGNMTRGKDRMITSERNNAINFLAGQLSNVIDAQFINANQDIKKELYMILKHNQVFNGVGNRGASDVANINVTFLPAEDVVHMYFNQDPITKRGISDLAYALFPAKLYSCLYITDTLGILTRGQDKRVWYVKQNIETNVSRTLLNVINQIKRGNFGARQMENLSNILNITGRFNDYVMPLSAGGDAPVTIDVIEGQKFTDNSELMDRLERAAINATDVPYDLIEARQSLDYAIQATMSNSKLMRNVYKRQDTTERFLSIICSKIYNYEYGENEDIKVELPAPSFLNMTNGQQLVEGTVNYIESVTNMWIPNETDEVKAEFKKSMINYYLPSHINISMINNMVKKAKMDAEIKLQKEEQ